VNFGVMRSFAGRVARKLYVWSSDGGAAAGVRERGPVRRSLTARQAP
jgi:hypothetical protein